MTSYIICDTLKTSVFWKFKERWPLTSFLEETSNGLDPPLIFGTVRVKNSDFRDLWCVRRQEGREVEPGELWSGHFVESEEGRDGQLFKSGIIAKMGTGRI